MVTLLHAASSGGCAVSQCRSAAQRRRRRESAVYVQATLFIFFFSSSDSVRIFFTHVFCYRLWIYCCFICHLSLQSEGGGKTGTSFFASSLFLSSIDYLFDRSVFTMPFSDTADDEKKPCGPCIAVE